jgi:drug/metabolite transporter (DMT)-like permease
LLAIGILWGGQTVMARFISVAGTPAFGYAFWQMFGAGCILAVLGIARRKPPAITPQLLVFYLVAGACGSAIPTANMYIALGQIPAGLMALILTTAPLITYSLALGTRIEGFDFKRAVGIGLGFCGALLILLPKGSLPAPEMAPFVALAFLTPAFYSLSNIYISSKQPKTIDSLQGATGMMFASAALLLPVSLGTGNFHPLWRDFGLANGLILLHMVFTSITFVMFFTLLKRAGPVYFSQVAYLITVTAVVLGIVLFDERHSSWVWGALAVVFCAVALVNWRQPDRNKSAASEKT